VLAHIVFLLVFSCGALAVVSSGIGVAMTNRANRRQREADRLQCDAEAISQLRERIEQNELR
jgi:hypothetical protein